MREALNLALQDYSGALIIVSHDRYLLNCVTNELWLVANNTVQTFKGDLNDYQQWVLEQEKIPAITEKTETSEAPIEKKPPISKQKIQKLEESIQQHEIKLKELDTALNDKQLYHESNKTKLQDLLTQREKISQKMQKLEEELLKFYED
jgi:ATP-binding cassette subfamily F protein 3